MLLRESNSICEMESKRSSALLLRDIELMKPYTRHNDLVLNVMASFMFSTVSDFVVVHLEFCRSVLPLKNKRKMARIKDIYQLQGGKNEWFRRMCKDVESFVVRRW